MGVVVADEASCPILSGKQACDYKETMVRSKRCLIPGMENALTALE